MIRVGIGGWTYAPWRGAFYPEGLKHADELRYASSKLTSIEINGTFYRTQSPASFAKWRDETPDDFVFAVKGHRAVVNKKVLAEAGEALDWFFKSGITELGDKLGPLLWQFAPFKKFDADDFGAFLALLPKEAGGLTLRHVSRCARSRFWCRSSSRFSAAQRRRRLRRFRRLPGDRRCHRGLRLWAPAAKRREARHRLPARRSRCMGGAGQDVGAGRRPGRPAALRVGQDQKGEARRVPLHDRRRQGARAGRGHGAYRAALGLFPPETAVSG
jgi:uncharacterized protein YecE (DUF72 family)